MQTKVIIENGEIRLDALDGQGEECREKHQRILERIKQKFGLGDEQILEACKPELLAEQETDTHTNEELL